MQVFEFPPKIVVMTQVASFPKYSAEDTSLVIGNGAGETTVLPIPARSEISIDIVGLHYNRKSHLSGKSTQLAYVRLHSTVLGGPVYIQPRKVHEGMG